MLNSSVENLKQNINIVDVVGSVVSLKRAGRNYKGVCPFHNEKTPSFVVSDEKQIFTCFGCHAKGDVIEFVMKYYNLDFSDAVEKLSKQYGIPVNLGRKGPDLEPYYHANKLAASYFFKTLTTGKNPGYTYLRQRGLSDLIIKRFGLGYADDSWDSLCNYLLDKGVEEKIILELGLGARTKDGRLYDKFRGRVMFPIINTSKKVIGFGGRTLDPNGVPKYLNSPENKVFKKKLNIYGLNLSRETVVSQDQIILVEGYMDVISLNQWGIENVGASLGTALTEEQSRLVSRYSKNVVLCYDSDSAGVNAAKRAMEILKDAGCSVKIMQVNDGKDPDEFLKKHGKKAFMTLVKSALPWIDFKLKQEAAAFNLEKADQKVKYLEKAVSVISSLNPIEQDVYTKKLARDLNVSEEAIRMMLGGNERMAMQQQKNFRKKAVSHVKTVAETLPTSDKELLKLALLSPSYIEKIEETKDIFKTSLGFSIFQSIKMEFGGNKYIDEKRVLDILPEEEQQALLDVMENVPMKGHDQDIFEDLMYRRQLEILKASEKEKIDQLALLGEDDQGSVELMEQLKEIQRKLKAHIDG